MAQVILFLSFNNAIFGRLFCPRRLILFEKALLRLPSFDFFGTKNPY